MKIFLELSPIEVGVMLGLLDVAKTSGILDLEHELAVERLVVKVEAAIGMGRMPPECEREEETLA